MGSGLGPMTNLCELPFLINKTEIKIAMTYEAGSQNQNPGRQSVITNHCSSKSANVLRALNGSVRGFQTVPQSRVLLGIGILISAHF